MIKIDFDSSSYVRAHGRAPKGRGCWAFNCGRGPEFVQGNLTLGEAKIVFRAALILRFGPNAPRDTYVAVDICSVTAENAAGTK